MAECILALALAFALLVLGVAVLVLSAGAVFGVLIRSLQLVVGRVGRGLRDRVVRPARHRHHVRIAKRNYDAAMSRMRAENVELPLDEDDDAQGPYRARAKSSGS